MKRIFKYQLPIFDGLFEIALPEKAIIRHLGQQTPKSLVMWCEIDDSVPTETRSFQVFGTGHPIAEARHFDEEFAYIGTVCEPAISPFVWHVYERP